MRLVGYCDSCDWSPEITEPEPGWSLFGTLGWEMAQHASREGHKKQAIDWMRSSIVED